MDTIDLERYKSLGKLVACLERLANQYDVPLPRPSLIACMVVNPLSTIQVLAEVAFRASEKDRATIAALARRLGALPETSMLIEAQGVMWVAHARAHEQYDQRTTIAETLRLARINLGMTQAEAAITAGVNRATWISMERGSKTISPMSLMKMCKALGVDYKSNPPD